MNFTDQLGHSFSLSSAPKRIISIVPSQTELLFDLGLNEEVTGITSYCIHPNHWAEYKTIVGGTKKLNIEKIHELKPDLIIGNKEENEKEQITQLAKRFPVWISDIKTLEDALRMIESIGEITEKNKRSLEIQNNIKEQFSHFKLSAQLNRPASSILYLIWRKPYLCAGTDTFIDHMLQICGLKNISASPRYPEISAEQIKMANPAIIFLSSEPYPFQTKHIEELQHICPDSKIILVDGEMFSWYGSRLLYAPSYFGRLLQNLY